MSLACCWCFFFPGWHCYHTLIRRKLWRNFVFWNFIWKWTKIRREKKNRRRKPNVFGEGFFFEWIWKFNAWRSHIHSVVCRKNRLLTKCQFSWHRHDSEAYIQTDNTVHTTHQCIEFDRRLHFTWVPFFCIYFGIRQIINQLEILCVVFRRKSSQ